MNIFKHLLTLGLLLSSAAALADGPRQTALRPFDLNVCKYSFSAEDYAAMSAVSEVPEASARYPGSYMYVPSDGAPHPGVVWLHGSEGGRYSALSMCYARYLASKGFAALFFCYSDCGTDLLPEAVYRVDLQRTAGALHWLRQSRFVAGRKVALSGASRGAEQTLLVGSLLAAKARTDQTIAVPDALFAHSPYGTIAGAHNWRWSLAGDDFRWKAAVAAHDADPSYPIALKPEDCWRENPAGPYADADSGKHYDWLAALCGVAPEVDFAQRSVYAWTWGGKTDDVASGSDIALEAFQGDVMISEGNADEVWPYAGGAAYLMNRLKNSGVNFAQELLPKMTQAPTPLPMPPQERVVFETFDGEGHRYSAAAFAVEWGLMLPFLNRSLN